MQHDFHTRAFPSSKEWRMLDPPMSTLIPEQLQKLAKARFVSIEASAGTGKTYTLERLFLSHILEGVSIDKLLVLTYTEKATQDMKQRIRKTLAEAHAALDPTSLPRTQIQTALDGFDRANISTIHAFCHRMIVEHAFETGLSFSITQMDSRLVFSNIFIKHLREALDSPHQALYLATLKRMGAVQMEELLFNWLEESGELQPHLNMDDLHNALQLLLTGDHQSTIDNCFSRSTQKVSAISALHALKRGVSHNESLGTQMAQLWAMEHNKGQQGFESRERSAIGTLFHLFCHLSTSSVPPAHHAAFFSISSAIHTVATQGSDPLVLLLSLMLPPLKAEMQRTKSQEGWIDFSDMLLHLHETLSRNPRFLQHMQGRFDVALVDEFQDTDAVQWGILEQLFLNSSRNTKLTVIGDPKQAIYSFRNADVHTYLKATQALKERGMCHALEVNYRSSAPMVEFQNCFFSGNFFSGINNYASDILPGKKDMALLHDEKPVCLLQVASKKKLTAKSIRNILAHGIAEEIAFIVSGGIKVKEGSLVRTIEPKDIFVLTRAVSESHLVAECLEAKGIRYAHHKLDGLFQTQEAKDILCVLKAILNPHDVAKRALAWLTPFFDLPVSELNDLATVELHHPICEQLFRWHKLSQKQSWGVLFSDMQHQTGLRVRKTLLNQHRYLSNVAHIFEHILIEAHVRHMGLAELIHRFEQSLSGKHGLGGSNVQRVVSFDNCVQLLTMHKSKGLEADVVFLFGGLAKAPSSYGRPRSFHASKRCAWASPYTTPSLEAQIQQEETEEHQRLIYVAMTRAKHRLYLPYFNEKNTGYHTEYTRLNGAYRSVQDRCHTLRHQEHFLRLVTSRWIQDPLDPSTPLFSLPSSLPSTPEPSVTLDSIEDTVNSIVAQHTPSTWPSQVHPPMQVLSYSSIKRELNLSPKGIAMPFQQDPIPTPPQETAPSSGEYPFDLKLSGARWGICMHDLLEHVPASKAHPFTSKGMNIDQWLIETLERHGYKDDTSPLGFSWLCDHTQRWISNIIMQPWNFGSIVLPNGLLEFHSLQREVPFYQYKGHLGPDQKSPHWIKGYIDALASLNTNSRKTVFVIDWKSDRLEHYTPKALEEHVSTHYALQSQVYLSALSSVLNDVADPLTIPALSHHGGTVLGGMLYVFLRAFEPPFASERSPLLGSAQRLKPVRAACDGLLLITPESLLFNPTALPNVGSPPHPWDPVP